MRVPTSKPASVACSAVRLDSSACLERAHARDLAQHAEVSIARRALSFAIGALQALARGTMQIHALAHARRSRAAGVDRHRDLNADRIGRLRSGRPGCAEWFRRLRCGRPASPSKSWSPRLATRSIDGRWPARATRTSCLAMSVASRAEIDAQILIQRGRDPLLLVLRIRRLQRQVIDRAPPACRRIRRSARAAARCAVASARFA